MAARIVVVGHIKAGKSRTIDMRVDNHPADHPKTVAAGLIPWLPAPKERFPKPDHDLIRKQRIEDRLARGEDDG